MDSTADKEASSSYKKRRIMMDNINYNYSHARKRIMIADYSCFRVPNLIEHENEGEVLTEAKKKAKNINESIKVFIDLWEKRGKIVTIDWAIVKPDSTVEYIYNPQQFTSASPKVNQRLDTIDLIIKSLKEQQNLIDKIFDKLRRQIEALEEKLKSQNE